jgi:hypothetical protein
MMRKGCGEQKRRQHAEHRLLSQKDDKVQGAVRHRRTGRPRQGEVLESDEPQRGIKAKEEGYLLVDN